MASMACLHLYVPNETPELVPVSTHHNHKPATNHSSISLPSSSSSSLCKSTTRRCSRVYNRGIIRASSETMATEKLGINNRGIIRASSETMATEKLGIKIVKNPPESKLTDLGVRSWPKWGCPPSKFPWTYSSKETCYLLKGKVKVYPEGSDEGVEIGAGDLVEFPKGMNCTWDVSETVDKHYNFE